MVDIPVANPDIGDEELENIVEAVKSGWIGSKGKFVEQFEKNFASYLNVRHATAVSNGTAALHLALLALGTKQGDEVIVPNLTFASPANMVALTGARPVFADVAKEYWCIDPQKARKKITSKTKAITVVHLYGHPARMDELLELANEYNIPVIEDCAEAHGAEFEGKKVGSFGSVNTFSFYANKIITTGEGGMVVTNDEEIASKVKILKDHGMTEEKRFWHETIGFNYRMTNLQAALGVAQLKKIDNLINRKREIARIYRELLDDTEGVTSHPEMSWAKNVYWMYSILVDAKKYGASRDDLMGRLAKEGVETRRFFYPLHGLPAYDPFNGNVNEEFPVSEHLSNVGINLPSGPKIGDKDIEHVGTLIKDISGRSH
jgi:perosamine synthetase